MTKAEETSPGPAKRLSVLLRKDFRSHCADSTNHLNTNKHYPKLAPKVLYLATKQSKCYTWQQKQLKKHMKRHYRYIVY